MVEKLRNAPKMEQRTAQTPAAVAVPFEKTIGSSSQISLMSDMLIPVRVIFTPSLIQTEELLFVIARDDFTPETSGSVIKMRGSRGQLHGVLYRKLVHV